MKIDNLNFKPPIIKLNVKLIKYIKLHEHIHAKYYKPYKYKKIKSLYTTSNSDDIINQKIQKDIGEPHPFEYNTIEQLSKRFALISAVIDKICDFALGDGYVISSN
ncbi:MAG: hypothetical protein IIB83_05280, partial [Bacteroidetes bacterium]|nr:hypothetical protein [Bacteroidota bacterium]